MNIWKRLIVILLVTFTCIGCDQGTKYLASENLPRDSMTSYYNDTLRIGYTENTGAFLGLGKNLPAETRYLVFTVLVGLFLTGFFLYLIFNREQTMLSLMALTCIFSGGASNLYDRALNNGAVVDFLNIGIGPLRTGIFNVADIAIMAGAFFILFLSIKESKEQTY